VIYGDDRLSCPKCDLPLFRNGDYFECKKCGYRRQVVKHLPTYAELLEENRKLKEDVKFYRDMFLKSGGQIVY